MRGALKTDGHCKNSAAAASVVPTVCAGGSPWPQQRAGAVHLLHSYCLTHAALAPEFPGNMQMAHKCRCPKGSCREAGSDAPGLFGSPSLLQVSSHIHSQRGTDADQTLSEGSHFLLLSSSQGRHHDGIGSQGQCLTIGVDFWFSKTFICDLGIWKVSLIIYYAPFFFCLCF